MTLFAPAAAGAVVTAVSLPVVRRVLAGDRYVRKNFRGRVVIVPGGLALVPALVAATILAAIVEPDLRPALVMAGAGLATAALGFVDDVFGDRHAGGLLGHARALLRGTITTGSLKAGGGAVIGVASAALLGWRGAWVIAAGAVVALASNVANLFDLRPARVAKLWVPLAVWVAVARPLGSARPVLVALLAAVVVFALAELREWLMLGDTGAGLLGAILGVATIAGGGRTRIALAGGVLLALTLLSERFSFTRAIDAVPPLRFIDRLGRRR